MCYNPKLDLVNMNPYIKFGENYIHLFPRNCAKTNFGVNQGPLLWYKCAKMKCNNSKLDLVNVKAYMKFGEILFICSQYIERKSNFGVNQGPKLWYKCAKNDV